MHISQDNEARSKSHAMVVHMIKAVDITQFPYLGFLLAMSLTQGKLVFNLGFFSAITSSLNFFFFF